MAMSISPNPKLARDELQSGNYLESKQICEEVLAGSSDFAVAFNVKAALSVKKGDFHDAIWRLGQAVALDPTNGDLYSDLAKTHFLLARQLESAGELKIAFRQYHEALRWLPSFYEAHERWKTLDSDSSTASHESISQLEKLLTICVCAYGDYPEYTLRCLQSILNETEIGQIADIYVGCNVCSENVMGDLRNWYEEGRISQLVESKVNLNRDGMQRELFSRVDTPYIVWFDDDSHGLPGWAHKIEEFIRKYDPFDAAGVASLALRCHCGPDEGIVYNSVVVHKPWFKGKQRISQTVLFPTGGCYIVRTDFVRRFDFPDESMRVEYGDILLGDLIDQADGILLDFTQSIKDHLKISDGRRRGEHGPQ